MDQARVACRLSPAPPTLPLLRCPPSAPHISSLSTVRYGYPPPAPHARGRLAPPPHALGHSPRHPTRSCSLRLWLVRLSPLPSCVMLASSLAGGGARAYPDVLLSYHSILLNHPDGSFSRTGAPLSTSVSWQSMIYECCSRVIHMLQKGSSNIWML